MSLADTPRTRSSSHRRALGLIGGSLLLSLQAGCLVIYGDRQVFSSSDLSNGIPARISVAAHDKQRAPLASPLPAALQARVVDSVGYPIPGMIVAWSVTGGQGSVDACAGSLTDSTGVASCTPTLSAVAGANSFSASAAGLSGAAKFSAQGTGISALHAFQAVDYYGLSPSGDLIQSGSRLYGMTSTGGDYGSMGAVFEVSTDGSGFKILHNFSQDDGDEPLGSLILAGSTLYGMTSSGGNSSAGAIFSLATDGSAFTKLHDFSGADGSGPTGGLVISGSTLYGMTGNGGAHGPGTIFSLATDGSGFTTLHSFSYANTDGANPQGSLILSGSVLYGMTSGGGANNVGAIFGFDTAGPGFNLLYSFAAGSDGSNPDGALVLAGSTLYGMATSGGVHGAGTVFSVGTDGSAFTTLHSFNHGDGESPHGSLILSGSTLYGLTPTGGANGLGAIFSLATDGSGFASLYSFGGPDGSGPLGSLRISGSTLYGMASAGGYGGGGTIFQLGTSGTGFGTLHRFGPTDGAAPSGSLVLAGSTLYGMTSAGGDENLGTVFSVATDGSAFANRHSFSGTDGANPRGGLILSGSTLYGMTTGDSGIHSLGTIFKLTTDGSGFTTLHSFSGADGSSPYGSLILAGSTLYGTTASGGANGAGTIFRMATDGSGFATLFSCPSFSGTDGYNPRGSLILSGSTLYGTTRLGGANDLGTVYKLATDGSGFTTLYSFSGADGSSPYGGLVLAGSTLYGTTSAGGANGEGAIFRILTDGSGFTALYSFGGGSDGSAPLGGLVLSGSTLYGTAYADGDNGQGTLFSLATDGSAFTTLNSLQEGSAGPGMNPVGDLLLSDGTLYGVGGVGGPLNGGTVISVGL